MMSNVLFAQDRNCVQERWTVTVRFRGWSTTTIRSITCQRVRRSWRNHRHSHPSETERRTDKSRSLWRETARRLTSTGCARRVCYGVRFGLPPHSSTIIIVGGTGQQAGAKGGTDCRSA